MRLDARNSKSIRDFENWVKDELYGTKTGQPSTKEQPMSDTLPASAHRVNSSGNCSISGCPCRGWSAQETASVKEVRLHAPVAVPHATHPVPLPDAAAYAITAANERERLRELAQDFRKWLVQTNADGTEYTVWPEWVQRIDAALNEAEG